MVAPRRAAAFPGALVELSPEADGALLNTPQTDENAHYTVTAPNSDTALALMFSATDYGTKRGHDVVFPHCPHTTDAARRVLASGRRATREPLSFIGLLPPEAWGVDAANWLACLLSGALYCPTWLRHPL